MARIWNIKNENLPIVHPVVVEAFLPMSFVVVKLSCDLQPYSSASLSFQPQVQEFDLFIRDRVERERERGRDVNDNIVQTPHLRKSKNKC